MVGSRAGLLKLCTNCGTSNSCLYSLALQASDATGVCLTCLLRWECHHCICISHSLNHSSGAMQPIQNVCEILKCTLTKSCTDPTSTQNGYLDAISHV